MRQFEEFEEKTIARKNIFKGHVIEVVVDDVLLPDGKTATRELVLHNGAVGIIPITNEGKILLVKQFRKPLEKVILEIPAGKIDPGEETMPERTARRELEEETGFQANTWTYVSSMYLSPGFSNEKMYMYYAEKLARVENPLAQDDDEVLELYELTLQEAKAEIEKGTICDSKTLYAIQYWELQLVK